MGKVYLPVYQNSNCAVIQNSDVIRVYETRPTYNTDVNYIDYYIHSDYISNHGTQRFNQYSTLPSCIESNLITNEYGYRIDFPEIMITSCIMIFLGYFFVSKVVRALFVDWRFA